MRYLDEEYPCPDAEKPYRLHDGATGTALRQDAPRDYPDGVSRIARMSWRFHIMAESLARAPGRGAPGRRAGHSVGGWEVAEIVSVRPFNNGKQSSILRMPRK